MAWLGSLASRLVTGSTEHLDLSALGAWSTIGSAGRQGPNGKLQSLESLLLLRTFRNTSQSTPQCHGSCCLFCDQEVTHQYESSALQLLTPEPCICCHVVEASISRNLPQSGLQYSQRQPRPGSCPGDPDTSTRVPGRSDRSSQGFVFISLPPSKSHTNAYWTGSKSRSLAVLVC